MGDNAEHSPATLAAWQVGKKMAVDFVGIGEAAQILGL